MKEIYPWLFVDYKEKLWKFSINEKSELYYVIMYSEGKWTKENLIDSRVTSFGLFIDENEGIHLIYSNSNGELRYCTFKDKRWLGKVLYKIEDINYQIESIKTKILGPIMHIFFTLVSQDGSDHGMLMHCIWDGSKISINKLQDIILRTELNEHYVININNSNEIYLFYLSDEGDEMSLNYAIYKSNKWIYNKRLYGIQGEEVNFEVELSDGDFHILNKYKENSIYYLDHVVVNKINGYNSFNIYSGKNNILVPLIFKVKNKICASWIQEGMIYYSVFNSLNWDNAKIFLSKNENKIERYNAYISDIKTSTINEVKVYGTIGLDLEIYLPKDFIFGEDENNNRDFNKEIVENKDLNKLITDKDLYNLKEENKALEDKLDHLNLLFEKNKQVIEKYKQQVVKLLEQKRKAEENSNVFLELQKKIQDEYDKLQIKYTSLEDDKNSMELKHKEEKRKYEFDLIEGKNNLKIELSKYRKRVEDLESEIRNIQKEKRANEEVIREEHTVVNKKLDDLEEEKKILKINLKEYANEIEDLNKRIKILSNNIELRNQDFEENQVKVKNLESQNSSLIEENSLIKKELSYLIEENKKLATELENEKNQSVMERLLRRKN